jgi:flagellar biosynthesis/type III secretory pathway M-ring protein FliF/YscJ
VSDPETVRTAISTAGAIIIALLGAWGTVFGVRRARRKRRAEVTDEEQEAVARYSADPGQFVKDVLRSNAQLTERVEAAEQKADRIERAFETFKREDRKFRTALARWVGQIMNAWGVEPEMPYPEGEDAVTLADVIPSALEATRPRPPRPAQ